MGGLHAQCVIIGEILLGTLDRIRSELITDGELQMYEDAAVETGRRQVIEHFITVYYRQRVERTSTVDLVTVVKQEEETDHNDDWVVTTANHTLSSNRPKKSVKKKRPSQDLSVSESASKLQKLSADYEDENVEIKLQDEGSDSVVKGDIFRVEINPDDSAETDDSKLIDSKNEIYSDDDNGGDWGGSSSEHDNDGDDDDFTPGKSSKTTPKSASKNNDKKHKQSKTTKQLNASQSEADLSQVGDNTSLLTGDAADDGEDVMGIVKKDKNLDYILQLAVEEGEKKSNTKFTRSRLGASCITRCESCSFTTKKVHLLERHRKRMHMKRNFECPTCSKKFGLKNDLIQHYKLSHENYGIICDICECSLSTKQAVVRHKFKIHSIGTGNFTCEHCNQGFHRKDEYQDHVHKQHLKLKTHKCKNCPKKFFSMKARLSHEKRCVRDYEFICGICKSLFNTGEDLRQHQQKHNADQYTCENCSKVFKWKNSYYKHSKRCTFKKKE